ncbi:MAG: FtsW/RodA/SpoVE family cell cycle protein [Lachnospiraceae bacterium]|nr:FtsW/RodA/SpoVE family cell cycle protein [Lachnospiraceae bacterium]
MIKQYRIRDYDFKLIFLVVALTIIGILAIGSAKESLQTRQIAGFLLGLFLMVVISLFDYSVILRLYWILYAINIVLLILVERMGVDAGGAQRWLNIFGIQFQPSETAKILLTLFFAQLIMLNQDKMNSFRFILLCIVLFAFPLLLIYNQPDMSTSIMVIILFCVIMFVGGISWKFILTVLAIAIPSFIIVLTIILQPDQQLIESYQQTRILAWLNPEEYANAEAYQQLNSEMAIGSGQLYGKGYNTNEISSVKNGNFISEPQTDFIFAVIGEEFGFIGGCTVIVLLIFIAFECIMVAKKAKDLAGSIIAASVAALIGFQGIINISVATGVIPNTGIPLPFVSYGLTSLVSLYIGVGFVLNIRLQCKK